MQIQRGSEQTRGRYHLEFGGISNRVRTINMVCNAYAVSPEFPRLTFFSCGSCRRGGAWWRRPLEWRCLPQQVEERRETGVHLWQGWEAGAQLLSGYKSVERQKKKASGEALLRLSFIYLFIETSKKRLRAFIYKLSFTTVSNYKEKEDKETETESH